MGAFITHKGIDPANIHRKPIVVAAIVAMIIGIFVGCGKDRVKVSGAEIEALSKQTKDLVTGLEYSDKVAEDFARMVLGWEDKQGQPVLVVRQKKFAEAKEDYKQGKISKAQLAKVEESIARKVSRRIRKEISGNEEVFDLADAIKHRQANCLGYSQLFYVLGNSIGLSVKTTNVEELMTGELSIGHIACIVSLTDGRTMMVDLAVWPMPMMIKPFSFEKEFAKVGNYWELIDKDNPLRIHRRIQILGTNGLIAYTYNSRGTKHLKLDQPSEAIPLLDKAIKLNPKCAEAYNNRGVAYRRLAQYTQAISDYTKAIELNPKYAGAYNNRGIAYHRLDDHDQAISDYTKAIELNPKDADAYYKRGLTYVLLGKSKEAKKDLLMTVKLDPDLKAEVKKIYWELFEFPSVDLKLD